MYIRVVGVGTGGGHRLSLRCPICGQHGTFEPVQNIADLHVNGHWLGQRKCPNPKCEAHLFYVTNDALQVLRTYPALRIDFDQTKIPQGVLTPLSEAITCHSQECYVASAIMIRRCLEELCADRGAKGSTLKDRLGELRAKIVLPNELFEAMDELRLLGNDAAHVEAKIYDAIGQSEVEIGVALTKEILKSVYQLDDLVSRLRALKKQP